jgi:hypothetical protein
MSDDITGGRILNPNLSSEIHIGLFAITLWGYGQLIMLSETCQSNEIVRTP